MEASFHIVGCVIAARPAAEQIDAFVTQVRRERASVLAKSAQAATFVRISAPDIKLVVMACAAAREQASPPLLRFGFAIGHAAPANPQGLDVGTHSVVQANDLAAGAADGEVLVAPQLAAMLIDAGFALRSRRVPLPGGRMVPACTLDLGHAAEAAKAGAALVPRTRKAVAQARPSAGLAPLAPLEAPEPEAPTPQQAAALGGVFGALLEQAEEVARRQAELEAHQDAVLAKMTLVDDGHMSAKHVAEMESALEAQLARVQERLETIDRIEQRVGNIQSIVADVERRLTAQLSRRAEVENLKVMCDALVDQMVDAHQRLEGVAAVQQRLLPMTEQAASLAQSLQSSQQAMAAFEERARELARGAEAVERQMAALAEREALLQAVKGEVDALRQIGERSRADVQFILERESALGNLRGKVEDLAGRVADTDAKIATIEARRKVVEEVQSHTSHITHLLGDIQLKLEILGEQRAEIDHVGDQLARLDFTVQEAQNTLRALQREREVAERIEQGIKALRARSSATPSI